MHIMYSQRLLYIWTFVYDVLGIDSVVFNYLTEGSGFGRIWTSQMMFINQVSYFSKHHI